LLLALVGNTDSLPAVRRERSTNGIVDARFRSIPSSSSTASNLHLPPSPLFSFFKNIRNAVSLKSEEPKQRVARAFHVAQNDDGFDEFKDAQENSGTLGGGGACNGVPDPADCERKKAFCVSTESIQKQCPVACDTCNTGVNAPKSVRLRGYLAVCAASCNTNGVVLHVKRTTNYTLRISRWMRNIYSNNHQHIFSLFFFSPSPHACAHLKKNETAVETVVTATPGVGSGDNAPDEDDSSENDPAESNFLGTCFAIYLFLILFKHLPVYSLSLPYCIVL